MERNARDPAGQRVPAQNPGGRASGRTAFPFFRSRKAELAILQAALEANGEALAQARRTEEANAVRIADLADAVARQAWAFDAAKAAYEARLASLQLELDSAAMRRASQETFLAGLSAERDDAVARIRELETSLAVAQADREEMNQLRELLSAATDVVLWDCNMANMEMRVSDSFYRLLGYDRSAEAVSWEVWRGLMHPEDRPAMNRLYRDHLLGRTDRITSECRMRRKDGEYRWFSFAAKLAFGADGSVRRYAGMLSDITDRKQQEAIIAELAYYDNLTGLPNRTHLLSVLESRLAGSGTGGALFLLDLDNFKTVNDAFGHAFGDRLLQTVAARLQHLCTTESACGPKRNAVVTRVGGDEFMIVAERGPGMPHPGDLADGMLAALRDPVQLDGRSVYLSGSIGLTLFPDDGTRADLLLKNADTALFRAKAAGRKCRVAYDAEMGVEAAVRMEMEEALRGAIRDGELALAFQPQVDLAERRITGYEALLRWNSRKYGHVPPDRFIPMAEECGVIHEIGLWVIREACRFAAAIPVSRRAGLRVSINVSPLQFLQEGLLTQIRTAIRSHGIPASMIAVEMTETLLMENFRMIVGCLQALRDDGCHIYLDDFGTGYSSLNYLKNLPIDVLKIDKSFVRDVMTHPPERKLLRAIIGMAHSLRLKVVAEGVETEEQRAFLKQSRCNYMQGYLFSRPLPRENALALLETG